MDSFVTSRASYPIHVITFSFMDKNNTIQTDYVSCSQMLLVFGRPNTKAFTLKEKEKVKLPFSSSFSLLNSVKTGTSLGGEKKCEGLVHGALTTIFSSTKLQLATYVIKQLKTQFMIKILIKKLFVLQYSSIELFSLPNSGLHFYYPHFHFH